MLIYIVVAYRFSDPDRHSYIVASCSTLAKANYFVESEEAYRGGKYSCCIFSSNLDSEADPIIVFESSKFIEEYKDLGDKYAAFQNRST